MIVRSLWHGEMNAPKRTMSDVSSEVAQRHGLLPSYIRSPARNRKVALARWEAMWTLAMEEKADGKPRYSLAKIGTFFNRDHTTVWNALVRYGEIIGQPYNNRRGGCVSKRKAG